MHITTKNDLLSWNAAGTTYLVVEFRNDIVGMPNQGF